MAAPTSSDYTSVAIVGSYMPDLNTTANSAVLTSLIHAASRFIDHVTGQWFYPEGQTTKFFNMVDAMGQMQGGRQINTMMPFFPNKIGTLASASISAVSLIYTLQSGLAPVTGDIFAIVDGMNSEDVTITNVSGGGPYTLTVAPTIYAHGTNVAAWQQVSVMLGYYENQPRASWLALNGDGITPPSNFFLYPPNPRSYSAAGATYLKPWWGLDLAHVPMPNTQFLPMAIGGYKNIAVTANWGWPAVPDIIADLTSKMVARSWQALITGHKLEIGSNDIGGTINMARHFDEKDLEVLMTSDLVAIAI